MAQDVFIVQSIKVREGIRAKDITEDMFSKVANGVIVDEVNLAVVYDKPPLPEEPQMPKTLCFDPSELHFSSMSQNWSPFDKGRSLQLINTTECYVASQILASGYTISPSSAVVPPESMFTVFITPEKPLTNGRICVQSIRVYKGSHITDKTFSNKEAYSFNEADIKAIYSNRGNPANLTIQPKVKVKLEIDLPSSTSIALHSTEPWALCVCNGAIEIWDYHKKAHVLPPFRVTRTWIQRDVSIAKFCEGEQCLVAGGTDSYIYVYSYRELRKIELIKSFKDHSGATRSFAVHHAKPYVMSSYDDGTIVRRNWNNFWASITHGHSDAVTIWNNYSADPILTLTGHSSDVTCVDFVFDDPIYDLGTWGYKQYLISGSKDKTVKVWDYRTGDCLNTLEDTCIVSAVCSHPELPIIFTGLDDGTVRMWNSNTCRLENSFSWHPDTKGSVCTIARKGSGCVIIGYGDTILIIGSDDNEA